MLRKLFPLLLLMLTMAGIHQKISSQERIYFPYFEMINVENAAGIQMSTSKLLKTYIEENHAYTVVIPRNDQEGIYPPEEFKEAIENAKRNGAKFLLMGEINNIGRVAVLSLTLYEVPGGKKVWSDLIKGLPLDDYDPVLSRIGRNFGTSTKAANDASLYDVTAFEEQRELKLLNQQSAHFVGMVLGGNYLMQETLNPKIGVNFYYDISSVILHMDMEYSSNAMFNFLLDPDWRTGNSRKNRTACFGMGVTFPFTKTKNSFYADAGLELGLISMKGGTPSVNEKGSGLGFSLAAGYLVGRNSTSNVRFQTGISIPAYKTGERFIPLLKFGIIASFAGSHR